MERLIIIPDPKPEIRKNAEESKDWEFHEEAQFLYRMAVLFKDRLLDPILVTDRGRLPDPVISFDDMRNNKVLAAYTLNRNPQGLLDEITFNTAHYEDKDGKKVWSWGRWAQLETLAHEQIHLWQENLKNKYTGRRAAHDKVFCAKAESLGLHPMPVIGCHMEVADGVFAELMKELGIERPEDVPTVKGKADWFRPDKKKGTSTLSKWSCGCQNVRIGTKEFNAVCTKAECGHVFVRMDGLEHTVYQSPE